MKKAPIYIAAAAGALCMPFFAHAENDLRTEINVDRTVVPVQRPASPLSSVSPSIVAPVITTTTLRPAEYGEVSAFDNTLAPLPAATYTGLKGRSPYKGYAALGYFPTFNLGASAGYRFVGTDRTTLGAWMQYDGLSYKGHGAAAPLKADGSRQSVKQNTITAGADFMQRIGRRSRLNVSLDYTYGALDLPSADPGSAPADEQRRVSAFNATASFHSAYGAVAWHVGADFDHFGQTRDVAVGNTGGWNILPGASENLAGVHLGAHGQFSKATYIGLEVSARFLHRTRGQLLLVTSEPSIALERPVTPVTFGNPENATTSIVKLRPYFGARAGRANMRLGADVNIVSGNLGNHVHVAPNVLLDWNPLSTVAVFAKFRGGDSFNSLRSLYTRIGTAATGAFVYTSANTTVAADFGLNIGPFYGAALELHGGYECTHNALMPVMLEYASATATGAFLNTDLSGWRAGAALSYRWRDRLEARASFDLLAHNYNSGFADAYDRAKSVTKVELSGKPVEKLSVRATYELRTGRRYYGVAVAGGIPFAPEARSMGNSSQLDLGARYMLTDAFSVGLRVENLLCRRADILPWLPGQGLHGLVGIEYKF